jgi:hypothetical protein
MHGRSRGARARTQGPALVHATVTRPYSHSLSDDERLYKTPEERAAEAARDPIVRVCAALLTRGNWPRPTTSARWPGGRCARSPRHRRRASRRRSRRPTPPVCTSTRTTSIRPRGLRHAGRDRGPPDTMVAAINRTMKDEMAVNPRIVVFGEDVADASATEARQGAGQGRRVQGDARPAAHLRIAARVQLAARRGQHRRPRRRDGHARAQAGRRDPVLRLHLARDDADHATRWR